MSNEPLIGKKGRMSKEFVFKKLHSLTGLGLTLFLIEHLFTNSLSVSFLKQGSFFVSIVNSFHSIPGLKIIEISCIALPFLIHSIYGIVVALEACFNLSSKSFSQPYCNFERNKAFTWQRVTAWLLILLIGFHVISMRFLSYPKKISFKGENYYIVKVKNSPIIRKLAQEKKALLLVKKRDKKERTTTSYKEVFFASKNIGESFLCILKMTFQSVFMVILYSILVLVSVYHGFNGLWSFVLSWGLVISEQSQRRVLYCSRFLMVVFNFLGLGVIWYMFIESLK